ncbi:sigma-70 family RNA polymerase sigma factor [Paenibacillus sp. Marseille-Q4541]|uniref:sigma-70 family RNA polymerase sigma factor n=1 Tax=Paenibacillus sp. Marseille-Q4541 TaxID=2831522 RepID=UPI001BAA58E9|nr:sigma-70 family RNA polymerase sigma factor [Paenibacillus sp. Marseille-Q4541]
MRAWIIKAQEGDPEAFQELVRHFSGMAHAVSYQKLGDFYLAQDAVQEAFTEAFLKLNTLEHVEAFPGWFRVIVERKSYRIWQQHNKVQEMGLEGIQEQQILQQETVEDQVSRIQLNQMIHEAVSALPTRSRVPVQLYYFYGYSIREISEYLETSIAVLKKRLFDARKKLKDKLPVADFIAVFHDLYEGGSKMLHIVNGDSVAEKLKQGVVQGDILVWREIYTVGPLFEDMSTEAHKTSRAKYLEQNLGIPASEYVNDCKQQEEQLAAFRKYDEVVLWFEHDLFDQTMLCYLLSFFAHQDLGNTRLNLLTIGEFPGIELFRGLGQLTAEQLKTLSGTWQIVSNKELLLGDALWKAYSASDTLQLKRLLDSDTSALPFAKEAYLAYLSRLPSEQDGIGSVEREVMKEIAAGEHSPYGLFRKVGDTLHHLGMGDLEFWYVLRKMAEGPRPLIELEGAEDFPNYSAPGGDNFKSASIYLS